MHEFDIRAILNEAAHILYRDNKEVVDNAILNTMVVGEAVVWIDSTGNLHHAGDIRDYWQYGFNPLDIRGPVNG